MIDVHRIVREINVLRSQDGENPEYDRALFELAAACFPMQGVEMQDRIAMLLTQADRAAKEQKEVWADQAMVYMNRTWEER